jgi:hypothetical protein
LDLPEKVGYDVEDLGVLWGIRWKSRGIREI